MGFAADDYDEDDLENLPSLEALDAEDRRCSLSLFTRHYWHVVEGERKKLKWNWHHEEICKALEQVMRGEIELLLIEVPPGSLKSTLVSVMLPAWRWLPGNDPGYQWLFVSGVDAVAERDALKTRMILDSEEYQRDCALLSESNGDETWEYQEGQNKKMDFWNTLRGRRTSKTINSDFTGARGDCLSIDDPIDAEKVLAGGVYSEAVTKALDEVSDTYENKMHSRRNDPEHGPIILIAQRLHERDLPGRKREEWARHPKGKVLTFPLEYDPERACPEDPRTREGELLQDDMWSAEFIRERKLNMLPGMFEAQFNQNPSPTTGTMFKDEYFHQRYIWVPPQGTLPLSEAVRAKLVLAASRGLVGAQAALELAPSPHRLNQELTATGQMPVKLNPITKQPMPGLPAFWRTALSFDTSVTANPRSDWHVAELWGQCRMMSCWLAGQWRFKAETPEFLEIAYAIIEDCLANLVIVENAGNGAQLVSFGVDKYKSQNFLPVTPKRTLDSKQMRAQASTPIYAAGRVFVPDDSCPWIQRRIAEHKTFPRGTKDDQVDAGSIYFEWVEAPANRVQFSYNMSIGGQVRSAGGIVEDLTKQVTLVKNPDGTYVDNAIIRGGPESSSPYGGSYEAQYAEALKSLKNLDHGAQLWAELGLSGVR